MSIEQETVQIKFVNPEQDGGAMRDTIQRVYDLTLEIQSAQEAIKGSLEQGFDVYKNKVSDEAKKGDYSKFIRKMVAEMTEGKVSEEVKTLENILDYVDLVKKQVK
jgi:hypothetical protein